MIHGDLRHVSRIAGASLCKNHKSTAFSYSYSATGVTRTTAPIEYEYRFTEYEYEFDELNTGDQREVSNLILHNPIFKSTDDAPLP